MTATRRLRDFIYMDTFRVRSFASQVNEGLAESRRIEQIGTHTSGSASAQDTSNATTGLHLTEDRLLLDHVYNELEDRILPARLARGNLLDIKTNPIIKVSGTVEIEDYRRIISFIERYNELGKMIAFPTFKDKGKFTNDKQRDNALAAHARNSGLAQDPTVLKNLTEFARIFNSDAFNILFDCEAECGYQIRAVIDRQCLRYTDEMLRGLYAEASIVPWTLVGIATYAPSDSQHTASERADPGALTFSDGTPSMAMMYRNMFRVSRFTASTFSRSLGNEIVTLPLAIYREFSPETTTA